MKMKMEKNPSLYGLLPRSIRWRIDLGLLKNVSGLEQNPVSNLATSNNIPNCNIPDDILEDFPEKKMKSFLSETENCSNTDNNSRQDQCNEMLDSNEIKSDWDEEMSVSKVTNSGFVTLYQTLQANNEKEITKLRDHYEDLLQTHYWLCSPLAAIDDTEKLASAGGEVEAETASDFSKQNVVGVSQDGDSRKNVPSTKCTNDTDSQTRSMAFLSQIKGRTPLVNPKSVIAMLGKKISESDKSLHSSDPLGTQKFATDDSNSSSSHNSSPVCLGSRWSKFYSSQELGDVIDVDLRRLPADHVNCFHRRKEWKASGNIGGIPMAEIRKEDLRRRIMSPMNDEEEQLVRTSREERGNYLSEILFVYAKEHPDLGYRQGMHEILSLIILTIEVDLFCDEITLERHYDHEYNDVDSNKLLDKYKLIHDAYALFDEIMSRLKPAYKIKENEIVSSQKQSPMETVGNNILNKIRDIAKDEVMYQFIKNMSVPPEMYCTRWLRLMFSREVSHQYGENIWMLWDAFFILLSPALSKSPQLTFDITETFVASTNLMNVLEMTAVSMLSLVRHELVPPVTNMSLQMDQKDPNECINTLMNYPPLEDPTSLICTLNTMIIAQQNQELKHIQNKKRFGRVKSWISERYNTPTKIRIDTSNEHCQMSEQDQKVLHDCSKRNILNKLNMPQVKEDKINFDSKPPLSDDQIINENHSSLGERDNSFSSKRISSNLEHKVDKGGKKFVGRWKNVSQTVRGALQSIDHTIQGLAITEKDSLLYSSRSWRRSRTEDQTSPLADVFATSTIDSTTKEQEKMLGDTHSEPFVVSNIHPLSINTETSDTIIMAHRLGSSIDKILNYFKDDIGQSDSPKTCQNIPQDIWDAIIDIQSVQEELLSDSR